MNFIFKISFLILAIGLSVKCSDDAEYKLSYFDIKGRGEFLRFIFAAANQKFEDNRIKVEDWPSLKPTTPFGQLPTLEIKEDGETIVMAQSLAIARYLANEFGMNGDTEIEEAFIDMYGEQLGDLFDATARNISREEAGKIVNTNLKFFEDRLTKNGNGFLVGRRLSWADIYLSQMTEFLQDEKDSVLSKYPEVKALDNHVRSIPSVAKWIENRPKTDL